MPMTSTPLNGFPDADSTGVRAGVVLERYDGDLTVTTDGAVISGLEINGTLRIEADNVIVRDCKIVNNDYNNIIIPDPYRATVEYCDIIGGVNGISGAGTFRGNDFSQNENGINVYGASLIEDNYIHDMSGGPEAHFDGIENNGASGMVLRHNTIINDSSQTAAVMLNNYFGKIDGAIIENNYLAGGGYTIYSDGGFNSQVISGVEIRDNYLGEGYWGYYAFKENNPLLEGNIELGRDWPTPVSDEDGGGGGGDDDLEKASVDHALSDFVERLTLTGKADINGVGNTLDNLINGNSGDNKLNGLAGADTMKGGGGDDVYAVADVGDRVVESAGAGTDTVLALVSLKLSDNVENLVLGGTTSRFNGFGNELDNVLTGNAGANRLNGGRGEDTMIGGLGNDSYVVDESRDVTSEAANGGLDSVRSLASLTLAANVENLRLGGSADIFAFGNKGDNVLVGNSGDNALNGKLGADTMTGGRGDDTFFFRDVLGRPNIDKITDFVVADDRIALDDGAFFGLSKGVLSAQAFRIIYDAARGQLLFDEDGTGVGAAILFTTLDKNLALTNADFMVV